jgi:hypothetical protein
MKLPKALNLLRPNLHYRRECFDLGLTNAGLKPVASLPHPDSTDAIVIWNRYGVYDDIAIIFERAGATVFVAENGYLGKHWRDGEWFALALGHHAGAGMWHDGGPQRWDSWHVPLKPFRTDGKETLVLGQRGIGEGSVRSPDCWAESAQSRFGGRIRPHPGNKDPEVSLDVDLLKTKQVLTWNSSAALLALMAGVPVWYEQKKWLGGSASKHLSSWKVSPEPQRDEEARLKMFQRLAWTMWTLDEIRSGLAFLSIMGRQT